ncbi:putative aspartic-type endopeptidase protein [Phaeoacremonium minimum UCRPA7]|uniref:Putative aspartic-type endopeptidase protein n=1 Tax=Phaeoacremonium minimum (strain UCR-PA7) TaxID=1286976 RepID=R8BKX4_PHAM7|nr:putative aspartic-type endopeptidase protein [Phaeoacremonium minimum UCRPA7]EOO00023.1 putative aspartic-type endopeptidase protein [Phaeoacremonium minimum UCRPA7]
MSFLKANFRSSVGAARQADHLRRKKASLEVSRALNHPAEVVKRDNKYAVVSAVAPTQTNSVGINQDGTDFSYFIEAGIGSASTPLFLLIDTGAGTSWAMGSGCKSTACGMHNSFGPDDSTTYKDSSHVFSIAYGSGSVAGTLAEDSISVAGLKVTMTFGIANTTSDDFTHFPFDGILGLSMNKGATDNFMASIKEDNLLGSNIFSVALSRNSDGQNTGEITFGATNPDKFTGDITYTSVSSGSNGDWAVPMDGLSYDGKDAGISGRLAYIDTGTSYVFGPPDDVAAIHKVIPDASSSDGITFTAPCDTDKPITVTFSGVKYTMSRKDWLSAPSGSGVCTSNIYGHEVVKGSWLLGDLFLKNVYAVFDVDKTRIGKVPLIVSYHQQH